MKKKVKIGDAHCYDMEKLYGRLLVISQKRDIDLAELFEYELAPLPSSLFDEYGDMRKSTKAILVKKLAVSATATLGPVDAELVDGNEAIYHKLWPKNVTVEQYANQFVKSFAESHDTYIIFDRYDENSVKAHERQRRAQGVSPRMYTLKSDMPLPPKDVIMKLDENKRALIHYLCKSHPQNPCVRLIGEDSLYQHEEADVKIISYLLTLLPEKRHIQVLADDTDIFVLLVYFVWLVKPSSQVTMRKYSGEIIDINATTLELKSKCYDLLALHALSGCDTVSYPFGKGKISAVNMLLKSDLDLNVFADPDANESDWMQAGLQFISRFYGGTISTSLNTLRFTLFSKKMEPPKIKSPTNRGICKMPCQTCSNPSTYLESCRPD